jgi:hypothetical protein
MLLSNALKSRDRSDDFTRRNIESSVRSFEWVINWHLKTCATCRSDAKVASLDEIS